MILQHSGRSHQTRMAEWAAEAAATSAAAQQSHRRALAPLQPPTRSDGRGAPSSATQRSQRRGPQSPRPRPVCRTQRCSRGESSHNPRPCSASFPIFLGAIYTCVSYLSCGGCGAFDRRIFACGTANAVSRCSAVCVCVSPPTRIQCAKYCCCADDATA